MLHRLSKHLEFCQNYSAACCIFISLSPVFDILPLALTTKGSTISEPTVVNSLTIPCNSFCKSHVIRPFPVLLHTQPTASIIVSHFVLRRGLLFQVKFLQKFVLVALDVMPGEFSDRAACLVSPICCSISTDRSIVQNTLVNIIHNFVFFFKCI